MTRLLAVILAVLVLGAACGKTDGGASAEAWQRSAAQTVFAVQDQQDAVVDAVGVWRLASIDACQELAFDSPCAMKLPERATVLAKVRALKASIQTDFKLLSRTAPSSEAMAEFRQLTSNYSADYGLSSAGTVTMVLKSGGSASVFSIASASSNDITV